MGLLKGLALVGLVVAALGLVGGVFRVVDERPDGSIRLAPRVSAPAVKWYAAKALSAVSVSETGVAKTTVARAGAR